MATPGPSCGYVFATSGRGYSDLAVRAAQTLRAVSPGASIDLFCDVAVDAKVFDQVHALERSWFRPKFEALRRSRFDKTIYLDADIHVLAPIDDIFEVLDRFDIAIAHNQRRNTHFSTRTWRRRMPAAFPQLNSGVLAVRGSPAVSDFLIETEAQILKHDLPQDQMVIRELIFDSDLRLAVLPSEYNLMDFMSLASKSHAHAAPRVLHSSAFRAHINRDDPVTEDPQALLGPWLFGHAKALIASDMSLGNKRDTALLPLKAVADLLDPDRELHGVYRPNRRMSANQERQEFVKRVRAQYAAQLQDRLRAARREEREKMRAKWRGMSLRKRLSRALRRSL